MKLDETKERLRAVENEFRSYKSVMSAQLQGSATEESAAPQGNVHTRRSTTSDRGLDMEKVARENLLAFNYSSRHTPKGGERGRSDGQRRESKMKEVRRLSQSHAFHDSIFNSDFWDREDQESGSEDHTTMNIAGDTLYWEGNRGILIQVTEYQSARETKVTAPFQDKSTDESASHRARLLLEYFFRGLQEKRQ